MGNGWDKYLKQSDIYDIPWLFFLPLVQCDLNSFLAYYIYYDDRSIVNVMKPNPTLSGEKKSNKNWLAMVEIQ